MVFVVGALTTNILPSNEVTLSTFTCSESSNHENIIHKMTKLILVNHAQMFAYQKLSAIIMVHYWISHCPHCNYYKKIFLSLEERNSLMLQCTCIALNDIQIVFLTALFYLLSYSEQDYLPVKWVMDLFPHLTLSSNDSTTGTSTEVGMDGDKRKHGKTSAL